MNVTTGSVRCSADQSDRRLGRRSLLMCEKRNGSGGPTAGSRERSARVTTPPPAWSPAARARACLSARRSPPRDCPCGDTSAAARCRSCCVTPRVAREIALEVARVVQEHAVRVELIGLAAEASERLQPVDELRFDLRVPALHLVFRRPVARSACASSSSIAFCSSMSVWPGAAVARTCQNPASSREF